MRITKNLFGVPLLFAGLLSSFFLAPPVRAEACSIEKDVLRVGYSTSPGLLMDTELGVSGLEKEILDSVGQQCRARMEYVPLEWDDVLSFSVPNIDLYAGGISVDPDRNARWAIYLQGGIGFAAFPDEPTTRKILEVFWNERDVIGSFGMILVVIIISGGLSFQASDRALRVLPLDAQWRITVDNRRTDEDGIPNWVTDPIGFVAGLALSEGCGTSQGFGTPYPTQIVSVAIAGILYFAFSVVFANMTGAFASTYDDIKRQSEIESVEDLDSYEVVVINNTVGDSFVSKIAETIDIKITRVENISSGFETLKEKGEEGNVVLASDSLALRSLIKTKHQDLMVPLEGLYVTNYGIGMSLSTSDQEHRELSNAVYRFMKTKEFSDAQDRFFGN